MRTVARRFPTVSFAPRRAGGTVVVVVVLVTHCSCPRHIYGRRRIYYMCICILCVCVCIGEYVCMCVNVYIQIQTSTIIYVTTKTTLPLHYYYSRTFKICFYYWPRCVEYTDSPRSSGRGKRHRYTRYICIYMYKCVCVCAQVYA